MNYPTFLSIVMVIKDQSDLIEDILTKVFAVVDPLVSDYEIILVDNGSSDNSLNVYEYLTVDKPFPNLQVYALTQEIDLDMANWVGVENALGDFVAVIDPMADDVAFIDSMLEKSLEGADVVFAQNLKKPVQSKSYRFFSKIFNQFYKAVSRVDLNEGASQYRIISKRVINYILQFPQPVIAYRHIPLTSGFRRVNLTYKKSSLSTQKKNLGQSIDKGLRLMMSTTKAPLRLVTGLCLFGAASNFLYSIYVIAVALLDPLVAPGWASVSLQQSGMFFLLSIVLLVLGEYILHMANRSNEGPAYYVGREFTSSKIIRHEKLNVQEAIKDV